MAGNDSQTIDINDPLLQQEMIEADPEADFFEPPPPPPDDREYQVRIALGDRGVQVRRQSMKGDLNGQRSGPLFLNIHLELRIIDPDQPWDNMPIHDNATSIVMRSTGTSSLHTILRAVGAPALGSMSLAQLKDHALSVFGGEPSAVITGKWEAQVEDAEAKGGYRTIRKGMKNFPLIDPQHPELGHSPYGEDKKTGETARAQFRIDRYRLQ